MTFEEYMRRVIETKIKNQEWRWGQTAFNVLWDVRKDLYREVSKITYFNDAFNMESRFWPLMEYLRANW